MKWFTVPALLASAVFSAVVVVPFLPAVKKQSDVFALEARAASSVAGIIKIYYDVGHGYIEADGSEQVLAKSDTPQLYRLILPAGEYRSIRFDPTDGPGALTLAAPLRIVSESGRVIRTIGFSELEPLQQIASVRDAGGRLEIVSTADANDPQLRILFSPPLVLAPTWSQRLTGFLPRAGGVWAGLVALLWLLDRARVQRLFFGRRRETILAHPSSTIALIAAVAVVASAYPVVFLGKSFVGPNFGTTLLYEAYPTLPGTRDGRMAETNGSDVGAAMWADVPYAFMQHRAVFQGELPLWNRYTVGGVPLLAQGQSMIADPLHFLVVLCNGAAWAWDLKFILAKWLFATGLGLTVLALVGARTSPSALLAALIVAASAPFIGFYAYRINHPAIFGVGYAPWILLAWLQIARAVGRRATAGWLALLFIANFSVLSSGTAKEAAILLLVMNLTGAGIVLIDDASWRVRLAKLVGAVWTGGLLLLVTAPGWATFLDALRDAFTGSSVPAAAQIQPSFLLGAFDELYFRPLSRGEVVFNPSLNLLLLLGVLYFLATIRLHASGRALQVLMATTLLCMAIVFGLVPAFVITQLPFLGNIGHIENCFLCALLVLWSVLAGVGFSTAAKRLDTPEGRADLGLVLAGLFVLISAWIGFRQAYHREAYGPGSTFGVVPLGGSIPVSTFIWVSLASSVVAALGLAVIFRRAATRGVLGAGGAILVALCVLVLLWRHGMHDSSVGFKTYVVEPPARMDFHAPSPAIEWIRQQYRAEPTRTFGLHGNLTPGWNAVYGLEAIYGADALQNRWVRELIDVSPAHWNSIWRVYVTAAEAGRARPFLDALNVRYYVDMPNNADASDGPLTRIQTADLAIYESKTAWPRAFFTDRVDTYDTPADLMAKFIAANGRPFAALAASQLAAEPTLARLSREMDSRAVVPARNYRLTENSTSFDIHAPGPGLIVLHEGWWPDSFRVDVNGRAVPLMRVNHAFKGIAVPAAGDFRVTFSYWPRHFTRYLAAAALGMGLFVLSFAWAIRRGKPSEPAPAADWHEAARGRVLPHA